KHVNSGWLFSSSSLKLPLSLIGMKSVKIKLAWMYMSMFTGVCLMVLVNVELILRSLVSALGGADRLRPLATSGRNVGAE
ncbi:MAG: TRAP transporter small permease, partial [Pseudomonadota bacterium]|nr:TRAP transporter small permease [Pseudomonadota bacterium]